MSVLSARHCGSADTSLNKSRGLSAGEKKKTLLPLTAICSKTMKNRSLFCVFAEALTQNSDCPHRVQSPSLGANVSTVQK